MWCAIGQKRIGESDWRSVVGYERMHGPHFDIELHIEL